jgi:diguanylate cyclase (GGDEF)-like protein
MNALISAGETSRLEALAGCNIQYGVADTRLELIARLASATCRAPVAFIAFVEDELVRPKSMVGIRMSPLARAGDFCAHTITTPRELTIVPDARHDRRFDHHPLVADTPHLRSFAGAPLLDSRGFALGALAVMDYVPRGFSDPQLLILEVLAKEASALLELCETVQRLEGELSEHLRYERRLEASQRELRQCTGLLKLAASTDSLTMLANRGAFDLRLAEEIERVNRRMSPLSLLMIDIDHFKEYNDSFGHPAGDEALRAVAQLLRVTVRRVDFAARVGGDEFAVILPFTDFSGAKVIAEKCRVAAEQHRWPHRPLHVSVGAAQFSGGQSVDGVELISAADSALYSAKFAGRNRVVVSGGLAEPDVAPAVTAAADEHRPDATGFH